MQKLLNHTYRIIYESTILGFTQEPLRFNISTEGEWHNMIACLEYKQQGWPERNYRLQILDDCIWRDYSTLAYKSKFALFSED